MSRARIEHRLRTPGDLSAVSRRRDDQRGGEPLADVSHMRYITARSPAKEGRVSKSAMIRARVEPELKHRAEAMLEQLGLTVTTAITLFYRQIIHHAGLPFDLRLPNTATRRAMHDARTGRSPVVAEAMDELLGKLAAT